MKQRDKKPALKPVLWVGDSREAVQSFPQPVRVEIGYALEIAQRGGKYDSAKPLRGLEAVEIVSDFDGDTFRAVYTVKLAGYVYVLHCFQKKSKRGIATPKHHLSLIEKRLHDAREDYKTRTAGR